MPIITDTTKAALLLTSRLVDVDAKPLTASEWAELVTRLDDAQLDAAALFDSTFKPDRTLHYEPEMSDRLRGRLDGATALAFELEQLMQTGIWAVATGDDDYPNRLLERLGPAAPPVLFGCGPASLLGSGGVGVVGSRDVSPEGAGFAAEVARAAAASGYSLVSGGARGVDQISMNAAAELGTVVGVLADSLQSRIRKAATRALLADERACLISQHHPASGFSVGAAMGRNKLIYALADLTVVVASASESGGTWAGATEAMRKSYGPVAVWRGPGEGPGNAQLEDLGAAPVKDVADVVEVLEARPDVAQSAGVEQLGMFE